MTWAAAVLMLPLVVDGSTNHSVNYAGEAAGNIAGNGVSRAAGKRTAGPVSVQPDYLEICRGILQQKLEHPYLVFHQREQERDSRTGQDRSVRCRSDGVAQALRGAFYADDRRAGADDQRSGGALHRDQSLPRLPDVLPERSLQPRIPVPDDRGAGVCRPGVLFRQQALRDGYLGTERTTISKSSIRGCGLTGSPTIRCRSLTIFP